MENFETENYLVEVVNTGHRIVDKCQKKATPIDESPQNFELLKDWFEYSKQIFESTCESLIKCSGENL